MKLFVLKVLQDMPEGIELEYEAIKNEVRFSTNYIEPDKFNVLNAYMEQLIKECENRNYVVQYDSISSQKFNGVLKNYRYVSMKIKKGDLND